MKIEVVVKDLDKALKSVKPGLGNRHNTDIMIRDGVHFAYKTYMDALDLRTTNYTQTITARLLATVTGDMPDITVSYKELSMVLKGIRQKYTLAYIEHDHAWPGKIRFTVDNHTYFLTAWPEKKYPPMPPMSQKVVRLALSLEEWNKLAYVARAADNSNSPRPDMDCINLDWNDNGKVRAVATDGFHLHYANIDAMTVISHVEDGHGRNFHIPATDILTITKLLPKDLGAMLITVDLPLDSLRYSVNYGGEYTGLLANGRYPEWESHIPKTPNYEIAVNHEELAKAMLEIVNLSKAVKRNPFAVLRYTQNGTMEIKAKFGDVDPTSWYVRMTDSKEFPALAVEASQVLDGIRGLNSEALLRMTFGDDVNYPVSFHPDNNDNSWFLTMPIYKARWESWG